MITLKFGKSVISDDTPCYMIAEIGHNHQGNIETAMKMIKTAAECGVNAVKFQKRDNKNLYTSELYNKPYENENSFGTTYGEHREFLEFGYQEYVQLKRYAESLNLEFMCTAFDFNSVDFLNDLGITSFKFASGDLTNLPLLEYAAKFNKPIFLSTGASNIDEIRMAYNNVLKYHDKLCLLHCVCMYPADYETLNLNFVKTLKDEFPEVVIGYSGHDNGILAAVISYMLGARVIEKHFTLNHASKGTDHKFSLEPIGLKKQIRDLERVKVALGDGAKKLNQYEMDARKKMGKSIYAAKSLPAGHVLSDNDIVLKSPGDGLAPYYFNKIIGKKLKVSLDFEDRILLDHIESEEPISIDSELNNGERKQRLVFSAE